MTKRSFGSVRGSRPSREGEMSAAAWSVAFKTVMHYMRASRAGKRATGTSRGSAGQAPIPKSQRCAVRVTYAGNAVRGQWRAHGRYLARESAAGEPGTAGFDRAGEGIDIGARIESWQASAGSAALEDHRLAGVR